MPKDLFSQFKLKDSGAPACIADAVGIGTVSANVIAGRKLLSYGLYSAGAAFQTGRPCCFLLWPCVVVRILFQPHFAAILAVEEHSFIPIYAVSRRPNGG